MKVSELRNKSAEELKAELHALLKEQFNLRIQRGSGQAPKSHLFSIARRNIARVRTLLSEKEKGSNV